MRLLIGTADNQENALDCGHDWMIRMTCINCSSTTFFNFLFIVLSALYLLL